MQVLQGASGLFSLHARCSREAKKTTDPEAAVALFDRKWWIGDGLKMSGRPAQKHHHCSVDLLVKLDIQTVLQIAK